VRPAPLVLGRTRVTRDGNERYAATSATRRCSRRSSRRSAPRPSTT